MNEEWRKDAHNKMTKLAGSIAESMGGSCELNIVRGYPVLRNDPNTGIILQLSWLRNILARKKCRNWNQDDCRRFCLLRPEISRCPLQAGC